MATLSQEPSQINKRGGKLRKAHKDTVDDGFLGKNHKKKRSDPSHMMNNGSRIVNTSFLPQDQIQIVHQIPQSDCHVE